MKQIKINEDTFDALLALAERGAQSEVKDAELQSQIQALQTANENEEELSGDRQARVDALVNTNVGQPAQPATANDTGEGQPPSENIVREIPSDTNTEGGGSAPA